MFSLNIPKNIYLGNKKFPGISPPSGIHGRIFKYSGLIGQLRNIYTQNASRKFSDSKELNDKIQAVDSTFEDLAKGCLFGALIGDSLGSYLEFKDDVSDQEVEEALKMPGGGPFHIGSGQITDDGELALCLGHGLAEGKGVLDLNKIAMYYGKWIHSEPFDIGITTRLALGEAYGRTEDLPKRIRKGASRSMSSQSNGALMRIAPLCIWASNLEKDDLIRCVEQETKLTHPNATARDLSVAYAYTVQHLLRNKGDNKGAYQKCKEIVDYIGNEKIKEWIDDVDKGRLPLATENIGWAKIAFCYSLYFLKEGWDYERAMRGMLGQGGDTDTNCCIVGAMLGALHGYSKLPKKYVETVMNWRPDENTRIVGNGILRPKFLLPYYSVDQILNGIIANRPTKATIIGGDDDASR